MRALEFTASLHPPNSLSLSLSLSLDDGGARPALSATVGACWPCPAMLRQPPPRPMLRQLRRAFDRAFEGTLLYTVHITTP